MRRLLTPLAEKNWHRKLPPLSREPEETTPKEMDSQTGYTTEPLVDIELVHGDTPSWMEFGSSGKKIADVYSDCITVVEVASGIELTQFIRNNSEGYFSKHHIHKVIGKQGSNLLAKETEFLERHNLPTTGVRPVKFYGTAKMILVLLKSKELIPLVTKADVCDIFNV